MLYPIISYERFAEIQIFKIQVITEQFQTVVVKLKKLINCKSDLFDKIYLKYYSHFHSKSL